MKPESIHQEPLSGGSLVTESPSVPESSDTFWQGVKDCLPLCSVISVSGSPQELWRKQRG